MDKSCMLIKVYYGNFTIALIAYKNTKSTLLLRATGY